MDARGTVSSLTTTTACHQGKSMRIGVPKEIKVHEYGSASSRPPSAS